MYFNLCNSIIAWYSRGITSCAIVLRICTITARLKNYQSIIKKQEKKHDKIELLAKPKLNSIEI